MMNGDTDSLFVIARAGSDEGSAPVSSGTVHREAAKLASTINRKLSAFVSREYSVRSRLELEFEKVYERFFVPTLRSPAAVTAPDGQPARVRGRAKGYAGLCAVSPQESGKSTPDNETVAERIEVKGMEAIRRDWTALAQELQLSMLAELFQSSDPRASRDRSRLPHPAPHSGSPNGQIR